MFFTCRAGHIQALPWSAHIHNTHREPLIDIHHNSLIHQYPEQYFCVPRTGKNKTIIIHQSLNGTFTVIQFLKDILSCYAVCAKVLHDYYNQKNGIQNWSQSLFYLQYKQICFSQFLAHYFVTETYKFVIKNQRFMHDQTHTGKYETKPCKWLGLMEKPVNYCLKSFVNRQENQ